MGKQANKARSSQLTGGEGFTYEDIVTAYFLTALIREEAALGQPGHVTRVAVPQDRQGEPMDDVIVDSDAAGDQNRLSVQVKRRVTISKSNDDFKQIIANAVATRAKTEFRPGLDRYGFITRARSRTATATRAQDAAVQIGSIRPALPQHACRGPQHLQRLAINAADLSSRSGERMAECGGGSVIAHPASGFLRSR
jgi:hypothetical protein